MSDLDLASQPHDAFFKETFSNLENASALLRGHLPAEIVVQIQWETLKRVPGSFVKQSLRQEHSDLLFTAKAGEREIGLYLLMEHQSTVDVLMPLRLLGYMVEIWASRGGERPLPLPPILGFLLHQGPDKWTVSTSFVDLFELPIGFQKSLQPYLPNFSHLLLDLSQHDPAREEDDGRIRVVLQLMKLSREKRILDFFVWLAEELLRSPHPDEVVRRLLLYAYHSDSNLDAEERSLVA